MDIKFETRQTREIVAGQRGAGLLTRSRAAGRLHAFDSEAGRGRPAQVWGSAPLLLALALVCSAQSLPTAESVLDRYVQVTGGKVAYENHKTEILIGTIAFPSQGLKGKLTRYSAAPDKERSIMELDALGKIESGVHNGYPWENSVILGPRIKAGEEREQSLTEARFNGPIEWRKIYSKVETKGTATINGEECYEVILTPNKGRPEHQFFSRKSGLLLRTTMTAASQMGDVDVEVNVSDYKNFGGILFPTRSSQKAGGQEIEITVEKISINEDIPASTLEPPEDVAVIIRKAIAAAAGKL
jgi:hypothetical protein